MTNLQVFIPSRGRWNAARRVADAWRKESFNVTFVVEPDEYDKYASKVGDATVDALHVSNAGIGNARNHCVNLAASYGYKSIILADDDIKPSNTKSSNMDILQEDAEDPCVIGITARYAYHDLAMGPDIKHRNDLVLLPTGMFRLVSLNVDNVLELGNYDVDLQYAEDCDLFLRALEAGYPWMTHLGTWSNSIGARYQPGGMIDFAGDLNLLSEKKKYWHEALYCKYPDFVNDPTNADFAKQNSIRISWRKAYNTYLPNWRKWSALHGGDIESYFEEWR